MSIDLICYVSLPKQEVERILDSIKYTNPDLFLNKFLIYSPRDANAVSKEIALEYGIFAKSTFLVSLNDKNFADRVLYVAEELKKTLQDKNVLILHGNSERL